MALEFLIPGLGAFYINEGKTGFIWFFGTLICAPVIYGFLFLIIKQQDYGYADPNQVLDIQIITFTAYSTLCNCTYDLCQSTVKQGWCKQIKCSDVMIYCRHAVSLMVL
jgi:hypothetical protein